MHKKLLHLHELLSGPVYLLSDTHECSISSRRYVAREKYVHVVALRILTFFAGKLHVHYAVQSTDALIHFVFVSFLLFCCFLITLAVRSAAKRSNNERRNTANSIPTKRQYKRILSYDFSTPTGRIAWSYDCRPTKSRKCKQAYKVPASFDFVSLSFDGFR
jgi:hypothetical protein